MNKLKTLPEVSESVSSDFCQEVRARWRRECSICQLYESPMKNSGSYVEFCNRLVSAVFCWRYAPYVGRYGMDGSAGVRTNFVGASGQTAV